MKCEQHSLVEKLQQIMMRISDAEREFSRVSGSVKLLAVSKTFPAEALRSVAALGVNEFGENYLQEALDKQRQLADLAICWHFIGPLQSNKSRAVAENFAWLHSLDRLKLASRLAEQRPASLAPLNVCIQVNISGEQSKSGVKPQDVEALAAKIVELPNLKLRGLMALPAPSKDFSEQRQAFSAIREVYEKLLSTGYPVDTLSMGMSADLEAAIAEGATIVRIGSALFGTRNNK